VVAVIISLDPDVAVGTQAVNPSARSLGILRDFQTDRSYPYYLYSCKAGGTTLPCSAWGFPCPAGKIWWYGGIPLALVEKNATG